MVFRSMAALALALATAAACSGSYEGASPAPDAGTDPVPDTSVAAADVGTDAPSLADRDVADAGPACDLDGPFVTIERMSTLDSNGEDVGLAITDEGLTAYVVRAESVDGSYGRNLYLSKRASTSSPWPAPALVPGFSGPGILFDNPSLPKDGRTIFLEARNGNLDIVAVLRDPAKPLDIDTAKAVTGVSLPGANEFDSYVTRDGKGLYFTSDRTGKRAIYRASLDSAGAAARLDMLIGISENGTEQGAVPSSTDDTLYFTRWLPTDSGSNPDLFVAKRPAPGADLGKAVPVAELNTPGEEYMVDISDDGCIVYFTSNGRPDAKSTDLYLAKKRPR